MPHKTLTSDYLWGILASMIEDNIIKDTLAEELDRNIRSRRAYELECRKLPRGSVTVRSEDRLLVYTAEHVRELEPAYAVTIHKSQGSEFPAVIIPVMDVPPKLCYRNLLYTGVTRAKTLCILAGHSAEVAQMVRSVRRNKRFSCLADLIRDETL